MNDEKPKKSKKNEKSHQKGIRIRTESPKREVIDNARAHSERSDRSKGSKQYDIIDESVSMS